VSNHGACRCAEARYPSGWFDDAPTYGAMGGGAVVALQAIRVVTEAHVEQMRRIRNVDRDGYSTASDEITPEQQARWWSEHGGTVHAWLYLDTAGALVGFGLVRPDANGHWCPSVGVLPNYRGRGYGKWIISDLTRQAPERLYAQAKRANAAGCRTHAAADWDEIDGPDPAYRYYRARFDPADDAAVLADNVGRYGFHWAFSARTVEECRA